MSKREQMKLTIANHDLHHPAHSAAGKALPPASSIRSFIKFGTNYSGNGKAFRTSTVEVLHSQMQNITQKCNSHGNRYNHREWFERRHKYWPFEPQHPCVNAIAQARSKHSLIEHAKV
ncbi:unnamed protein product [Linum tenue]|uniref:Uncharacterized protein n=1 Tax=Linum tenue TaxID=586396 RepID=A0AAV0NBD2_9ROSI|nr:unnamed protein product [Linum tenue]